MKSFATSKRGGMAVAVVLALSAATVSTASAQERHEFRGPRVELDARYHHDHYYPVRGVFMERLPVGSVSIGFGRAHYYYHAGVWFRPVGARFEVITPPIGVVIPALPSGYCAGNCTMRPVWPAPCPVCRCMDEGPLSNRHARSAADGAVESAV